MCSPQASNAPSASSSSTRSAWIFLNKSSAPRSRQATRLRLAESHRSRCARDISAAIEYFVLLMFVSLDKTGRDCGVDCLYKILVQKLPAIQNDIAALWPQILGLFLVILPGELKQLGCTLSSLRLPNRRHRVQHAWCSELTSQILVHERTITLVILCSGSALVRAVRLGPLAVFTPFQLRVRKWLPVASNWAIVDFGFRKRCSRLEILWLDLPCFYK